MNLSTNAERARVRGELARLIRDARYVSSLHPASEADRWGWLVGYAAAAASNPIYMDAAEARGLYDSFMRRANIARARELGISIIEVTG